MSTSKDTGLAMILEILPGLFGFLGIGHIYAGYTTTGILLLIGWMVAIVVMSIISGLTLGVGLICQVPLMIVGPVVSGLMLKSNMEKPRY